MSVTRKLAAVAAFAAVATMGIAGPASAGVGSDNGSSKSSVLDVSRNNILNGIQLCHNNVNVLGVQVPVQDLNLAAGLLGAGKNTSYTSKDCVQPITQVN